MRPNLLLALLVALPNAVWAAKKPIFIDLREDREARRTERDEERAAQARIAEVMRKMESGDLPKIQFAFDSAEILPESYPTLEAVLAILSANPTLKLMVRAHTCAIGSDEYNLDLSRRRAKAVKEWLVKKGVPPPSVRYRGLGYHVPIADNSTPGGREKNRRVEFRVTFRDWDSVY